MTGLSISSNILIAVDTTKARTKSITTVVTFLGANRPSQWLPRNYVTAGYDRVPNLAVMHFRPGGQRILRLGTTISIMRRDLLIYISAPMSCIGSVIGSVEEKTYAREHDPRAHGP